MNDPIITWIWCIFDLPNGHLYFLIVWRIVCLYYICWNWGTYVDLQPGLRFLRFLPCNFFAKSCNFETLSLLSLCLCLMIMRLFHLEGDLKTVVGGAIRGCLSLNRMFCDWYLELLSFVLSDGGIGRFWEAVLSVFTFRVTYIADSINLSGLVGICTPKGRKKFVWIDDRQIMSSAILQSFIFVTHLNFRFESLAWLAIFLSFLFSNVSTWIGRSSFGIMLCFFTL